MSSSGKQEPRYSIKGSAARRSIAAGCGLYSTCHKGSALRLRHPLPAGQPRSARHYLTSSPGRQYPQSILQYACGQTAEQDEPREHGASAHAGIPISTCGCATGAGPAVSRPPAPRRPLHPCTCSSSEASAGCAAQWPQSWLQEGRPPAAWAASACAAGAGAAKLLYTRPSFVGRIPVKLKRVEPAPGREQSAEQASHVLALCQPQSSARCMAASLKAAQHREPSPYRA